MSVVWRMHDRMQRFQRREAILFVAGVTFDLLAVHAALTGLLARAVLQRSGC
jgi:hypothetical protein